MPNFGDHEMKQRLAAILAADVAGYSCLIESQPRPAHEGPKLSFEEGGSQRLAIAVTQVCALNDPSRSWSNFGH